MPPKAKPRATSRGAAPGVKSKPKAKAKAKAAPEAPPEDLLATRQREAEELFEQHEPDGNPNGVLTLAQFAEVVRAVNRRKCMLWGDDPVSVTRREWARAEGAAKKSVTLADFRAWFPGFADAADAEAAEKVAAQQASSKSREEKYARDGVWRIALNDLQEAMGEARRRGKTPIVVDNTPGGTAEAFFLYSGAHIVECKRMIMEKAKGASAEEVLDKERWKFFDAQCFQRGKTVAFCLQTTACDLKGMFNSDVFPSAALLDVREVVRVLSEENAHNMKASPFL